MLDEAKRESGVVGKLSWGSKPIDTAALIFDDEHIGRRHPGVTRSDAISFIENALVTVTRNKGVWQNYYSAAGAAYVNMQSNLIRTAFTSAEYDDIARKMLEVVMKK